MSLTIKTTHIIETKMAGTWYVQVEGTITKGLDWTCHFRMFIGSTMSTLSVWQPWRAEHAQVPGFPKFKPYEWGERKPIKWISENLESVWRTASGGVA